MEFALHLPINSVSFGQVSTLLLRGCLAKNIKPSLFPLGGNIDLNSQEDDKNFFEYISHCAQKANKEHSRNTPTLKLWHLSGSTESFSRDHYLLSFYELDQPTSSEINVAKNCDKLFFSNKHTQEIFNQFGVNSEVIPLAFDRFNFKRINKKYFDDDRIVFNLVGKFEKRKHHQKIIQAWTKKFGNNKKYFLQCALYNPFLNEQQNKQLFSQSLGGKNYFNVQFLGPMPKNTLYNDFLNSGDVVIGMSGGEGWGLPEFQSVGLGKHAVILNATGYKEWATPENSLLVEPSGKIEVYDNLFFHKGKEWNQGNIYDFKDDDFISACEEVIKRVENKPLNSEGLKITQEFTIEKTLEKLLPLIS